MAGASVVEGTVSARAATPDYSGATWTPASLSNYTVANRPHNYPVDMIVVHDIEGTAASAISMFEDPARAGSAHYVVDYNGAITQMVQEKDVAWHAGNWDYNTRAIGIEHAGYACCSYYTTAEYQASAHLIASICSRWGVPMDRSHVIGHSEVPDPDNPGLYGGSEHHTDPGAYWNWSYYMSIANTYANALPSPPHLGPDPAAYGTDSSATVTWHPAHTCHLPVTGYTVTAQPGGIVQNLPATATSAKFTGLTNGVSYKFTVATQNADGSDSLTSNSVVPNPACTNATVRPSVASPQYRGAQITFNATSSACPDPKYAFFLLDPAGAWNRVQDFSSRTTWTWDTTNWPVGNYTLRVWANEATSDYSSWQSNSGPLAFVITTPPPCATAGVAPKTVTQQAGSTVAFNATSTGCPNPRYEYWIRFGTSWYMWRPFSSDPTWNLSTAGFSPGTYVVHVWANQQGDQTAALESVAESTVTLTGCTSASVTPASGSSPAGTAVTFTASSGGCTNAVYEFWLEDTQGYWHLMQGWGANTWTWSNAGWGKGTYHLHVWAMPPGAYGGSYEVFGSAAYSLT